MHAYVLSVSSSSLKLGLAELEVPTQTPELERLHLDLTRCDVDWTPAAGPAEAEEALAALRASSAEWPAPDMLVTVAQWESPVAADHWAACGRVLRVAPADLAAAQDVLPQEAGLGNRALRLALAWAQDWEVPVMVVPAPSNVELPPEARETGVPGLRREPRLHVLNAETVAREAAASVGKRFADAQVVVAHLGSSCSVTAFAQGRVVDSSGSGLSGGPLGLRQAGPVSPATLERLRDAAQTPGDLAGELGGDWRRFWTGEGGLRAMTGYGTARELAQAEESDPRVRQAAAALVHSVAKAVGEQCGALPGRPDALVLTGPLARWDSVMDRLERRLSWMAPVLTVPGDLELDAVARAAGRAALGWAAPVTWQRPAAPLVTAPAALGQPL